MTKKPWRGHFSKSAHSDFEYFSQFMAYDDKLAEYDLLYSLLHIRALYHTDLLSKTEYITLSDTLEKLLKDIQLGIFRPDETAEDIHSDIQNKLFEQLGTLALKIYSFRSRNDQIAFDTKLYCFQKSQQISKLVHGLIKAFFQLEQNYPNQPFIGYTHMQRAQLISFSTYCQAWQAMFLRDQKRLISYLEHFKTEIGTGVLAGSFISRNAYQNAINSVLEERKIPVRTVRNALDHVSDRDFVLEFQSILSLMQMHFSRFSEDMILYGTSEFDWVDFPEEFYTDSSLIPHKKNACFLERIRGYTGRLYGNLFSGLTVMKGLPLSYNHDIQLDKETLLSSVNIIQDELNLLIEFIPGIRLKTENIAKGLEDECLYIIEIMEFLAGRHMAFKDAHDLVERIIQYTKKNNIKIKEIKDSVLKDFHPILTAEILQKIMTPEYVLQKESSMS